MAILFENFVLSTLGQLPKEKEDTLNAMNLAGVFKLPAMDWQLAIKQVLQLSDTIEIAILDLWYENQEIASRQGREYHPAQFALDFTEQFFRADSRIDRWTADTLRRAQERIKQQQARGL